MGHICSAQQSRIVLLGFLVLTVLCTRSASAVIQATPDDNPLVLGTQITLLSGSTASTVGGAVAPWPLSAGFEVAAFGFDVGLLNTPAAFDAPADIAVNPNSVPAGSNSQTRCVYRFAEEPGALSDVSGFLTDNYWSAFGIPFGDVNDNSFSGLGRPYVYHAQADVEVNARNSYLGGNARPEFPSGRHRIDWQADTQLNTILDLALPGALIATTTLAEYRLQQKAATPLFKSGARATRSAAKKNLKRLDEFKFAADLGLEAAGEFSAFMDSTTIVTATNTAQQQLTVWDTSRPYVVNSDQLGGAPIEVQEVEIEATDFGGVRFGRKRAELQQKFVGVDDCGRQFVVQPSIPDSTLLRVSTANDVVVNDVRWELREIGGGPYQSGFGLSSNQQREGESLVTYLTQKIVVRDNQAPLLVPPAGFASEAPIDLTVGEFPLGRPLVVDLADPEPQVERTIAGNPDVLTGGETGRRYAVQWNATDAAGNDTVAESADPAEYTQIVTVKPPGANTPPLAVVPAPVQTLTSQPVDILLGGLDDDVIDGIPDPLRFRVQDYPRNGQFEAPIYPYFIHDFRLTPLGEREANDRTSRVSPLGPGLAAEFAILAPDEHAGFLRSRICNAAPGSAEREVFSRIIPRNFVYRPTAIQVADSGDTYLRDSVWACVQTQINSFDAIEIKRVSRWTEEGELLDMFVLEEIPNGLQGEALQEPPWIDQFPVAEGDFGIGSDLPRDRNGRLWVFPTYADNSETVGRYCSPIYSFSSALDDVQYHGNSCSIIFLGLIEIPLAVAIDAKNDLYHLLRLRLFPFAEEDEDKIGTVLYTYEYGESGNFYGEPIAQRDLKDFNILGGSMSVGGDGALYMVDPQLSRIHKWESSKRLRNGTWEAGDYVGWMGRCRENLVNSAGVPFNNCDEDRQQSRGFACTEGTCRWAIDAADQLSFGTAVLDSSVRAAAVGVEAGQFSSPGFIAIDKNDVVYVSDTGNQRIQRFGPDGTFAGLANSTGTGINTGAEPGFLVGNLRAPGRLSLNSSSLYVMEKETEEGDFFVHSFKTLPFFDVTDSSATLRYVSSFSHQGPDQFSYLVDDGIAVSAPAVAQISVSRADRAPERLFAQCYGDQLLEQLVPCSTPEDGAGLYIRVSAEDKDGFLSTGGLDSLTFSVEKPPTSGQLVAQQFTDNAQVYHYVPATDYNGKDSFSYSVVDSRGFSSAVADLVEIEVLPTPDPVVVEFRDEYKAARGFPFSLTAQYSDVDRDELQANLLSVSWGDGVNASDAQNWEHSGRFDSNSREISPQLKSIAGSGIVVGSHTYDNAGNYPVALELDNLEPELPNTAMVKSVQVIEATVTGARLVEPAEPVAPDTPFEVRIEVENHEPDTNWSGLTAANAIAQIALPEGLTVITPPASCSGSQTLVCSLGDMVPGAKRSLMLQAQISLEEARKTNNYPIEVELADAGPKLMALNRSVASIQIADSDDDGVIDADDDFDDDARYATDTDGDGLPDAWERTFGYDPNVANDTSLDADNDGVSLLEEFNQNSFPELADESRAVRASVFRAPDQRNRDQFGDELASADFNQDGYTDVVVGANIYNKNDEINNSDGAVFIFYGGPAGTPQSMVELNPVPGFEGRFGGALHVQDFDGNGFPDLLVAGLVREHLYYNNGEILSEPDKLLNITASRDAALFASGDLDGDSVDDMVVSYCIASTGTRALKFYLSTRDENSNPIETDPILVNDGFPCEVRSGLIADIDGDGENDLILGQRAPAQVNVYLASGKDWFNPNDPFVPSRILRSPNGEEQFGYSMSAEHDLGGDGVVDLVVGAVDGSADKGWVFVYDSVDQYYTGPTSQRVPSQVIEGRAGKRDEDDFRGDSLGASLAVAHLDHDNFPDLVVSAHRAGADDTGEVHIYRGNGNGFTASDTSVGPFSTDRVQYIEGTDEGGILGFRVAAIGDNDGDGVGDIAISAPGFSAGAQNGFVAIYLHAFSARNPSDDEDQDGVRLAADNCADIANTNRSNVDGDTLGDACDPDADNDSMDNEYERTHGLDELDPSDALGDLDGDGLTNIDEFQRQLSPSDPDTDRDGIDDGAEIARGSNPLFGDTDNDGIANTIDSDDDDDGLLDVREMELGLDPLDMLDALRDLDGDGISNLAELQAESDPNDIGSVPIVESFSRLVASVLPGHRSTQTGRAVTAFATIINTAEEDAVGCSIVPLRPVEARWSYTATDTATNAPNASKNTAVPIAPGEARSYVFEIEPAETMSQDLELRFDCANTDPVATIMGLNSFGLTVSDEPAVDMVALAATLSGNGIVEIDGVGGTNAFALASVNVGVSGSLIARARGSRELPMVVTLCETDSTTGACLNGQLPRSEWLFDVAPNATPTFSVFVTATGDIPLDAAKNRVVVEFINAAGVKVGSSSVALTTQ